MRLRLIVLGLAVASSAACGSSSTAPSAPAPSPTAPAQVTLAGHVTATNGGQPLAGLSVDFAGHAVLTDAAGGFTYQQTPFGSVRVALTGAAIVPRSVLVAAGSSRTDV